MRIASPPIIRHPSVILRQIEKSDLPDWFAYLSLPEVTQETSWAPEAVNNLEAGFLNYISTDASSPIRLAIVDIASGKLVGTIGFHSISAIHKTAEIAYDLSPAHWGNGIATAACRAMTAWGFDDRGFMRIQAAVLETNTRSEKVLENCGFQFEGVLRAFRLVRNTPGNFKLFSRIATD